MQGRGWMGRSKGPESGAFKDIIIKVVAFHTYVEEYQYHFAVVIGSIHFFLCSRYLRSHFSRSRILTDANAAPNLMRVGIDLLLSTRNAAFAARSAIWSRPPFSGIGLLSLLPPHRY